ncbi:ciliogenesis-associated TTC17-interacting protein isoform X1 [Paramormyrops kingsleyae]|nr:ciliogenesis-associated TTC17-interacting protein isoform X1 [Paramormyrops kingsleyae]
MRRRHGNRQRLGSRNTHGAPKTLDPVSAMEEETREDHDAKLASSKEAKDFLSSIESRELDRCLFADSLITVSDTGRELGEFTITMQNAVYNNEQCYLLHANSHGSIDDIPCGTSIMAYISKTLETLEQNHHEYVQLQDHSLDRKSHMVRHGDQLVVNKIITEGEEVKSQSFTFPVSSLEGFVSEASNLLILRILAQRKIFPENMVFLSLDTETQICFSTYKVLGERKQLLGTEFMDVFGIQRTVESVTDISATWHCYFLSDGHLASRVQVGSPVTMKLLHKPADKVTVEKVEKPVFEKKPLVWEEDMQMFSRFLDRKEELRSSHASYVQEHPELKALLADFLQFLLLRKPDDVLSFAVEYFAPFGSQRAPGTSTPPVL